MSAKTAVRDYSVELSGADSYRFKTYLQSQRIQFKSSGCWNLVHFSITCTPDIAEKINGFLEDLFYVND